MRGRPSACTPDREKHTCSRGSAQSEYSAWSTPAIFYDQIPLSYHEDLTGAVECSAARQDQGKLQLVIVGVERKFPAGLIPGSYMYHLFNLWRKTFVLADSALPNKAKERRFCDIRRCIGCNDGCVGVLFTDHPITCVLNPMLGHEYEGEIETAPVKKKVAVVGAGPAGLYAAIAAAKRGHEVTVYEKGKHAGGNFYTASIPPCKGEIHGLYRMADDPVQTARRGDKV